MTQRVGAPQTPPDRANHEPLTEIGQHVSLATRYQPEQNPFQDIMVDLTHRCNMECENCYIPNRDIPDMDKEWLFEILGRLPRRTRIRLVGAEPTMRLDLPEIISNVKKLGHTPVVLTNGLKLANWNYVKGLRQSGLFVCYLSFNGGFTDSHYKAIDGLACADKKSKALENLIRGRFYISLGIIVVRGVNESVVGDVFRYAIDQPQIREIHIRSVGAIGRYLQGDSYSLEELHEVFQQQTGFWPDDEDLSNDGNYRSQFRHQRLMVKMTQWPDLGSKARGRLAPDGTIQPFFEHVMANEGGY